MRRKHIIIFHLILWIYLVYPEFWYVLFPSGKTDPSYYWMIPANIFLHVVNFYLFYLFIMPYFLKARYKIISVVIAIGFILLYTCFRFGFYWFYDIYIVKFSVEEILQEFLMTKTIILEVRASLVITLYAFFTRFTIDWFNNQKLKTDLVNQNQANELALLRSQINPHFLFNTLNNIYYLVSKKSDDAPEAIMKLSSIMRYTLYEANTDMVAMGKEIEFLNSFIELQKLRLKQKDFVQFNIEGSYENLQIAPMLLISFVENAFKHGKKNVTPPGIIINITIQEKETIFEVINYLQQSEELNIEKAGGFGLQKIRRRLELLYSGKHKLQIESTSEKYHVKLNLQNS